jgi:Ser-tRNA(Ala) deacylase AlaX
MTDKQKSLPPGYALVESVLREGKENSKTSKQIIRELGWQSKDHRTVLHIMEQLITKYGYLIGSSRKGQHKGYYLIETEEEYKETMRTYNAQIQAMLNRHRKLQENYLKKDQLELEGVR